MASNFAKLWFQSNLNKLAINSAGKVIQNTGRALPCSVTKVNGSIVTVKLEIDTAPWTIPQLTIPKAESQWIRVPTQVGDKGIVIPADAYLGGISGLGDGNHTLVKPGNLGALMFFPVAATGFPSVNTNQAFVCGPDGVLLQTKDGSVSINLTESGIVITVGSATYTFSSSNLTTNEDVIANGISLYNHDHKVVGVQAGGSTIVTTPPQG